MSIGPEPERERTRLEASSHLQASRMANLTSANMTGAHNFTNNITGVHNFTNNMTGVHNLTNAALPGLNVTPAPPSLDLTGVKDVEGAAVVKLRLKVKSFSWTLP